MPTFNITYTEKVSITLRAKNAEEAVKIAKKAHEEDIGHNGTYAAEEVGKTCFNPGQLVELRAAYFKDLNHRAYASPTYGGELSPSAENARNILRLFGGEPATVIPPRPEEPQSISPGLTKLQFFDGRKGWMRTSRLKLYRKPKA